MIRIVGQRLEIGEYRTSYGLPTFYLDTDDFDAAIHIASLVAGTDSRFLSLGMVRESDGAYRSHAGAAFQDPRFNPGKEG